MPHPPTFSSLFPAGYPRRLGRYTLLSPLGEGGMATVHVAQRDGDPRLCVLKQLHLRLTDHEETSRRFYREAHIASQLNHPGIARVVDAGVEDGVFCIALELIAGQTVEQIIRRARARGGTLPFEVSIHILLQALDALVHAHELSGPDGTPLGLVHRDLSPRNIMVGYDGHAKLIDFGIAKGRVDDHQTAVGVLMGTPYYMSPEQARALEVDPRSDLYTLGAVFFELLTGHRLVSAKGRARILMAVVQDPTPKLSVRNPLAPPELGPVLEKALEKDPDRRFPTARSFRAALFEAYEAALARARSAPPTERLHRVGVEQVGRFLQELMPEGEARARALLEEARGAGGAGPPFEATRLAVDPEALEDPRAVVPTRLADPELFMDPTRASRPFDGSWEEARLEPTIAGLPAPGGPATSAPPSRAAEPRFFLEPTWSSPGPRHGPPVPLARRGLALAFLFAMGLGGTSWLLADCAASFSTNAGKEARTAGAPSREARGADSSREAASTEPRPAGRAQAASAATDQLPVGAEAADGEAGAPRAIRAEPRPPPMGRAPATPAPWGRAPAKPASGRVREDPEEVKPEPPTRPPERDLRAPRPLPNTRDASSDGRTKPRAGSPLTRLERALRTLRARPDRAAALRLAERIHREAAELPAGRARWEVQAEVERVMRISDVDAMIDALDSAVTALAQALR